MPLPFTSIVYKHPMMECFFFVDSMKYICSLLNGLSNMDYSCNGSLDHDFSSIFRQGSGACDCALVLLKDPGSSVDRGETHLIFE